MNYEETYPKTVSYNQYEELKQERDSIQENYENIDFKFEELKTALKEVVEAKTEVDRLDKLENFYEWCKENQYEKKKKI